MTNTINSYGQPIGPALTNWTTRSRPSRPKPSIWCWPMPSRRSAIGASSGNATASTRRRARRFGCTFEGIFRQATLYKGRSRDTAWFSIIDGEWPALAEGYRTWPAPDNFDQEGRQRVSLGCARREIPPSSS